MKKISSAIFLATFLVFINCKSDVGSANNPDSIDSTSKFYQSVIALGNGFLDVFKSFGELVAETIGFKADPKKSEVKNYFTSMISKLEVTKKGLVDLPKGNGEEGKGDAKGAVKSAAESVVALIGKLITAAKEVETAATGTEAVGNVVKADAGGGEADANSVKGIAKGIKAIVDAVGGAKLKAAGAEGGDNEDAGKLFFGKKDANGGDEKDASKAAGAVSAVSGEQIIKAIVDAAGKGDDAQEGKKASEAKEEGNEDAGKLFFGKKEANKGGDEKDASKAAGAVSAVSGEQIIKAIVDAAGKADGEQEGKKASEATNPIQAAIGAADEDEKAFEKMKKDDQIAAAIALRGMAKDGKFAVKDADAGKGAVKSAAESVVALIEKLITAAKAVETAATGTASEAVGAIVKADGAGAGKADANSVKGIAKGIKAIVDADGAGEKLKAAGAKEGNENAGKLFTGKGADKGGDEKDASKAAGAVSAVSGEQIIKAIVDAAGKAGGDQEGKKAGEATNPIAAAIGAADDDEKAFEKMKKDDQIAAAIALRGMAKDGKFAVKNANEKDAKGAVKSAAESVVALIGKLITAAKEVADAATGTEAVGAIVKANADGAGKADKDSVKGIAKGIKAIVEAVGGGAKLKAAGAEGEGNGDAGKLFTGKKGANKGGDEKDASKAAGAVSAVSGEQIIKAIVDAVGGDAKLKAVAGAEGDNEDAGKLFFGKKDANGGEAKDASKAAGAVSAVSGEQIIKAIVDAAGKGDDAQAGVKASEAANPIQAAIGTADENAEAFEKMKKDDQIAAAIALRGMAKDGKFAVKDADAGKGAVKSAAESVVALIEKLITAAKAVADAATGTASEAVGAIVKADGAGKADANSVKGIAKGIKAIVEAVGGGEKLKAADAKEGNENAGKLFGKKGADKGGDEKDASKAAGAVSAVSGEQIIKAIVDAAGKGDQEGKKAEEAANPIQAAIGAADENAEEEAFDKEMKKDDQIAAAIALRGMAKDGKFAVKDANENDAKGAVKSAAESVVALIEKLITAAKAVETAATGGAEAVGNVVKANDAGDRVANADSVKGIAKGIKAIVEAVGGGEKLKAAGGGGDNEDAGKLFTGKGANGGDEKDASKAAGAVSAVSGEQIIKAIVDAAGKADGEQAGKKAEDAANPIQAAIGTADDAEKAFGKMKKDDQIAAAIALRGMAKDGKFAVKDADAGKGKGAVKSAAESVAELIEKLITAAKEVETAATGTASEAVGAIVAAKDAGVANAGSVKGIAKGG